MSRLLSLGITRVPLSSRVTPKTKPAGREWVLDVHSFPGPCLVGVLDTATKPKSST